MTKKKCSCGKPACNGRLCHCCHKAKYRKNNPLKSGFQSLKDNAKRRGKVFGITFDEYKEFVTKTSYFLKKGRKSDSYHIDRKDETGPYAINNIQLLTNAENIRKFVQFKQRNERGEVEFTTVTIKQKEYSEVPF